VSKFQAIIDDKPTAFWPCENLSGATVSSLIGPDASVGGASYGALGASVGVYSNALELTSATTSTRLLTGIGASAAWTTFTTTCVFRADSLSAEISLMSKSEYFAGTTASFPFNVLINTNGSVSLILSNGGDFTADLTLTTATGLIVAGAFYHVGAVVRASGLCEIYIDGVQVASSTTAFSISTSGVQFAFGGHPALAGGGVNLRGLDGVLAGCGIFPTALSGARLLEHAKTLLTKTVSGIVRDNAGAYAARTVRAYRRDTGVLVAETTSNGTTGAYTLKIPTATEVTVVCFDDSGGTVENDEVLRTTPA
jgi:Concanavalin A-like lectin/glucanases superfamily